MSTEDVYSSPYSLRRYDPRELLWQVKCVQLPGPIFGAPPTEIFTCPTEDGKPWEPFAVIEAYSTYWLWLRRRGPQE